VPTCGAPALAPAVQALESVLVRELGEREVTRRHAAGRALVGHGAVLRDLDVGRARRDLDQLVGGTRTGRGRVLAHHVQTVSGHEEPLVVRREVAGARVLQRGRQGRRGGCAARAGADTEPALAGNGDVERVTRRLKGATAHHHVDRADLGAEADLSGVGAARAGRGAAAAALHLRQRVAEGHAARLVAERVDIRDVGCGHVEHDLVCFEAADGGKHASHHWGIVSL
jgi:hypothetical protein